jgi:hypothetical protein
MLRSAGGDGGDEVCAGGVESVYECAAAKELGRNVVLGCGVFDGLDMDGERRYIGLNVIAHPHG